MAFPMSNCELNYTLASSFRDKFILKGGMLIAAMVGIDTRSTLDMDATIKGTV